MTAPTYRPTNRRDALVTGDHALNQARQVLMLQFGAGLVSTHPGVSRHSLKVVVVAGTFRFALYRNGAGTLVAEGQGEPVPSDLVALKRADQAVGGLLTRSLRRSATRPCVVLADRIAAVELPPPAPARRTRAR